jgi:hypothetical protein
MPLNPTGSEIPRSLTEIGTTIDAALNGKADFVRVTDNPAGNTVASSYEITGSLSHTGGSVITPLVLDYVSPNFWADSVGGSLVVSSGKWLLTLDFLAVWLSNETIATPPEDCEWAAADENTVTVGDPILTFTPATVATTGQFALVDDTVNPPVMWQNLGDDVTPDWVPLTTATALSAHTTATGNVHGLSGTNVRSILGVSTLSGSNTGDQNLAPYAPLASPALTGDPTAPTQTAGNDSTRIATTAFVAASFATTSAVAATYKSLKSSNATLNYSGGLLTSVSYANGSSKTLTHTSGVLTRVDFARTGLPTLRKDLTYTSGALTGVAESEI